MENKRKNIAFKHFRRKFFRNVRQCATLQQQSHVPERIKILIRAVNKKDRLLSAVKVIFPLP